MLWQPKNLPRAPKTHTRLWDLSGGALDAIPVELKPVVGSWVTHGSCVLVPWLGCCPASIIWPLTAVVAVADGWIVLTSSIL